MEHYGGCESNLLKEASLFPDPELCSRYVSPSDAYWVHCRSYSIFCCSFYLKKEISGPGLMSTTRLTGNVSVKYVISKLKIICGNISASTEILFTGLLRGVWQMSLSWNLVYFPLLPGVLVSPRPNSFTMSILHQFSFKSYYSQRQSIDIF